MDFTKTSRSVSHDLTRHAPARIVSKTDKGVKKGHTQKRNFTQHSGRCTLNDTKLPSGKIVKREPKVRGFKISSFIESLALTQL